METDAETHNQISGRALASLQEEGGRIVGASGVKDNTRKPTEPTILCSQGLTEDRTDSHEACMGPTPALSIYVTIV